MNHIKRARTRGNRALGAEAEQELRKLLERDEKALLTQQEYEISLIFDLLNSNSRSAMALGQLENAKLRHQLATELHESLKKSVSALQIDDSTKAKAKICDANDCNGSQHLADVACLLRKREEIIGRLSEEIKEASESVNRAFENVVLAEMNHESAAIILRHQQEERARTVDMIKRLKNIIREKKIPLQACFRTPLNVWEEIFTYVVSADGEPQPEIEDCIPKWVHGARALMLSSVCHSWRVMLHSLPSLWRYIFIPLSSDFNRFRPRIIFHIQRCKAVQPVVAVFARGVSSLFTFPLFRHVFPWVQEIGIARLTYFISGGSYFDITSFIQELPPPVTFIVRDVSPNTTPAAPFQSEPLLLIPGHFYGTMTRLETSDVRTAPSATAPSQRSTLVEYAHTASVTGRYALPNWIQSNNETLQILKIDAPWPSDQIISHIFTNVRVLEMALKTLAAYIRGGNSFPSLRKLTLLHTLNATDADWTSIRAMPLQDLRTVGLRVIGYQNVPNLIAFINQAQGVGALELYGPAVLGFLTHGGNSAMEKCPKIKTLTILDFQSPLPGLIAILQHIVRRPTDYALSDVVFVDCPKVSLDTRIEIMKLINLESSSVVDSADSDGSSDL